MRKKEAQGCTTKGPRDSTLSSWSARSSDPGSPPIKSTFCTAGQMEEGRCKLYPRPFKVCTACSTCISLRNLGHMATQCGKGQQETRQQCDLSRTRFSQYDWSRTRTQLRMRREMCVLGNCPASYQKEFLTSREYVTGPKEREV